VPTQYTVQKGDCIASIADSAGLLPETIWNNPANAGLKRLRGHGHILLEGDVVVIPDRQLRHETRPTDQCHTFVRKGVPIRLRIVLCDENQEPRAGLDYILEIDGTVSSGTTSGDGAVDIPISPRARSGSISFGEGLFREVYELQLGGLDPITEINGVQMRLENLGYYQGGVDGKWNDATHLAILSFQKDNGLEATGEIDDALRAKLVAAHGS
jgi:N-acetylmuramoyl-L-alanine amidase